MLLDGAGMSGRRDATLIVVLVLIGTAASLLASAPPSAAHEHIQAGPYELTVGWREEPPLVGELNGLFLRVEYSTNGTPVEGAHQFLAAVLMTGSASLTAPLGPQFGQPGVYTFDVIPTRAGNYSVRLMGTLGTTSVDVVVALDNVRPASAVAFPAADPTASELQARLDTLQTLLILTIVVALIGLTVGAFSLSRLLKKARGPEIPP